MMYYQHGGGGRPKNNSNHQSDESSSISSSIDGDTTTSANTTSSATNSHDHHRSNKQHHWPAEEKDAQLHHDQKLFNYLLDDHRTRKEVDEVTTFDSFLLDNKNIPPACELTEWFLSSKHLLPPSPSQEQQEDDGDDTERTERYQSRYSLTSTTAPTLVSTSTTTTNNNNNNQQSPFFGGQSDPHSKLRMSHHQEQQQQHSTTEDHTHQQIIPSTTSNISTTSLRVAGKGKKRTSILLCTLIPPLHRKNYYVSDFTIHVLDQMETTVFSTSDSKWRRQRTPAIPIGFPGVSCAHCGAGGTTSQILGGRYFPSSYKIFMNKSTLLAMFKHLQRCDATSNITKQELRRLLKDEKENKKSGAFFGSKSVFYNELWGAIHSSSGDSKFK